MNPAEEAAELALLQKQLGITDLGDGYPIAGFNLLAAMACTLANVAPDDGSIIDSAGRPARLGTSLLVLGAAGVGRIVDEVICEVGRLQSNFTRHHALYTEWRENRRETPGVSIPQSGAVEKSSNLIMNCGDQFPDIRNRSAPLAPVFATSPEETFQQVAKSPKFMVSAVSCRDLTSQFTGLRPGKALVHLGLNRPEDLSSLTETCSALLEGRYPLPDRHELLRGHLIVTDSSRVLARAANSPEADTGWIGQLLWLSDDRVGPNVTLATASAGPTNDPQVAVRFRIVLPNMMAWRAGTPAGDTQRIGLRRDTKKAQYEWMAFLNQMERSLPGITGACRNLLTSLVFGLDEMAILQSPIGIRLEGIEAFARFLVRRMANTRTAILRASELTRRQIQIGRIFHKIANGGTNERQISKTLKIAAVERDECLRWLEETGHITRGEQGWMTHAEAQLNFNSHTLPLLEI